MSGLRVPARSMKVDRSFRLCRRWMTGIGGAIHNASLDAVAVAVAWHALMVWALRETTPTTGRQLTLALSVWCVYTVDRLLDGRQIDPDRPHTRRHAWHRRHQRPLIAAVVVALPVVAFLVAWQSSAAELAMVIAGLVAVGGYFVALHAGRWTARRTPTVWMKAFAVAMLLAAGIMIPVFARWMLLAGPIRIMVAVTALIATAGTFAINCILVSRHEERLDRAQSFPSTRGRRRYEWGLLGCVASVTIVALVLPAMPRGIPVAIAVGLVLMVAVVRRPASLPIGLQLDAALVAAACVGMLA